MRHPSKSHNYLFIKHALIKAHATLIYLMLLNRKSMITKTLLPALFLSLIILSCKKENLSPECESLHAAMQSSDIETAKAAITKYINGLASQQCSS